MSLTIGELNEALLARFPLFDQMEWDNCGLIVGDPEDVVRGICLSLDPTAQAIAYAHTQGSNVLITHHPIFLDPTHTLVPTASYDNFVANTAFKNDVALIALHTPLDRAKQVQAIWPARLGLSYVSPLEERDRDHLNRMGQIAELAAKESLIEFITKRNAVLGNARVWGDKSLELKRIAIATGSGSSLVGEVIKSSAQLFIAGEIKYHAALELLNAGIASIEIGHDVSENPLMDVVFTELTSIVENVDISIEQIRPQAQWWVIS